MSIEFVTEALEYFQDYRVSLGHDNCLDIDECILLASDEGRIRFIEVILETVLRDRLSLSERVILGSLRAIVDPFATMLPYSIFSPAVFEPERASVFAKMHRVFVEIFFERCEPVMAHCAQNHISPWNSLCFMWWEVLPRHGVPSIKELAKSDIAILNMMAALLNIDHIACKEAALHGLAHWQCAFPEKVQEIVDQHLDEIPPCLRDYAEKAKEGNLV